MAMKVTVSVTAANTKQTARWHTLKKVLFDHYILSLFEYISKPRPAVEYHEYTAI